jgi:hypothetical protein
LNQRKKDGRNKDKFFSKFCKFRTLSETQVVIFEKRSRCTILLIINSNKGSTRGRDNNSWFGEKNRQIRQEKKCHDLDLGEEAQYKFL